MLMTKSSCLAFRFVIVFSWVSICMGNFFRYLNVVVFLGITVMCVGGGNVRFFVSVELISVCLCVRVYVCVFFFN